MKTSAWLLCLLLLATFRFVQLNSSELHSWDEAIYASWGRAIAEHNLWLDQREYPVWDYQSRRYPPLFLWGLALSFRMFGFGEAAARAIPALCGALIVLLAFHLGTLVGTRSTGLWAATFVGLNYILTHFSRFAMTESTYLMFLLGAFVAYLRGLSSGNRVWLLLAGIALGLSAMTKGVVALLFPLGGILFVLLLLLWSRSSAGVSRSLPSARRALRHLGAACAIGFLFAAPWHVFMLVSQGGGFVHDYFLWNVVERVVSGVDSQTQALGPLYYLNQLPIRMPFAFALFVVSLLRLGGRLRSFLPAREGGGRGRSEGPVVTPTEKANDEMATTTRLLLLAWFLVALAVFSTAQSKLVQYTPPIIFPALLLAGLEADRLWKDRSWGGARVIVLFTPVVLAWAALTPWRLAVKRTLGALARLRVPDSSDDALALAVFLALVLCCGCLLVLARKFQAGSAGGLAPRSALVGVASLAAVFALYRAFVYEPKLYRSGAGQVAGRLMDSSFRHAAIVSEWIESPLIFYMGAPSGSWQKEHLSVVRPADLADYLENARRRDRSYVILDLSDYKEVDRWGRESLGGRLAEAHGLLERTARLDLRTAKYELWFLPEAGDPVVKQSVERT